MPELTAHQPTLGAGRGTPGALSTPGRPNRARLAGASRRVKDGGTEEGIITRILVIEDDDDLAGLMTDILLDAGYQTLHVSPHTLTYHLPGDGDVSLVVCSLGPGASRSNVSDIVGWVRQWTMAPILACTTDRGAAETAPCQLGVEALLAMPFEIDDLVGLVRRLAR